MLKFLKNYIPQLGFTWASPLILIIKSPTMLLQPLLLLIFPQNYTPYSSSLPNGNDQCTDFPSQTYGYLSHFSCPVLCTLTHFNTYQAQHFFLYPLDYKPYFLLKIPKAGDSMYLHFPWLLLTHITKGLISV